MSFKQNKRYEFQNQNVLTNKMFLLGEAADAARLATAATFDMTREVERSKGLSSKTLSTNLLNSVCLKY